MVWVAKGNGQAQVVGFQLSSRALTRAADGKDVPTKLVSPPGPPEACA